MFVLCFFIRYKDGHDKMGEHKDDEKSLDPSAPIASVSLGEPRSFYFVHQDVRRKKRKLDKGKLRTKFRNFSCTGKPGLVQVY